MLNTIALFWQPHFFTVKQVGKQKVEESLESRESRVLTTQLFDKKRQDTIIFDTADITPHRDETCILGPEIFFL